MREPLHQRARLVYSTDVGRVYTCPRCGQPTSACECAVGGGQPQAARQVPSDGVVRLARQSKGRGGKPVTRILGLPGDTAALARLAHELKHFCGAGGTVRGDVIEIQGEQRERLEPKLRAMGYQVKRAGG